MTWTQGQPFRSNQPPFTDVDPQDNVQQPPVSRNYTRSNDHRPDHRQRQSSPRPNMRQQDVAATFTQEGLQTFSLIFSSAVEAAIAKSLPDIVERAIERKMRDMVLNFQHEIEERTSNFETVISGQIETVMTTYMEHMLEELSTKFVNQNVNPQEHENQTVPTSVNQAAQHESLADTGDYEVGGTTGTLASAEIVEISVAAGTAEVVSEGTSSDAAETAEMSGAAGTAEAVDSVGTSPEAIKQATDNVPQEQFAEDVASFVVDATIVTHEEATLTESDPLNETDAEGLDEGDELALEEAELLYQQTQRERRESAYSVSVPSDRDRGSRHRGRVYEEGRLVIEALRKLGRPVKTSELPNLIQDVHWGSNPSAKIKSFMDRSNGQIQRTGRGVYAYQAVSR
ncbi:hypothetical protein [Alicyclobacillus ferrooxydans]|uniref:Uncharacterized protein n=1 Tax=Alicyclobacillus ferrooxydans TaxID=471514 RepID=A0A0P9CA14_9BACL|nr:hypothetical protein [Alicyclobacillus ferrooxydans]KPV42228.1 hypothetical protein AN477_18055 [Alicyclobacillus ferrooxydans]